MTTGMGASRDGAGTNQGQALPGRRYRVIGQVTASPHSVVWRSPGTELRRGAGTTARR